GTSTYTPGAILATTPSSAPTPTRNLLSLIRTTGAAARSFAVSGQFAPTSIPTLSIGLDVAHQTAIDSQVSLLLTQVDAAVADYKANKLQYVQGLITELQNQNTQTSLTNKANELIQKAADLSSDMDGLRLTAAGDNARYGDFMKAFAAQVT